MNLWEVEVMIRLMRRYVSMEIGSWSWGVICSGGFGEGVRSKHQTSHKTRTLNKWEAKINV